MGNVITGMRMSLDGFINDPGGSVAPLYPDMNELSSIETIQESIRSTGAVVMGRNSFDMASEDYDWSTYEYQVPIIVLTHHPPRLNPKAGPHQTFTFVTDGIESAVAQAKQAAGSGQAAVILDYTPESAAPLMKAAEAQGVVNDVLWGSSTPIANEFTAEQVGNQWGAKNLFINSEFSLLDTGQPDQNLYRQITQKYIPSVPIQSFGQMGFLVGKFTTAALLSIRGEVTKESYNKAVKNLKNQKSDILCKPWYFGNLPLHIPNNWDITVTYKNGIVVAKEKCFAIASVDPQLVKTRAWEKQFKLNVG